MRNKWFPIFNERYGNFSSKLIDMASAGEAWGSVIEKSIVLPCSDRHIRNDDDGLFTILEKSDFFANDEVVVNAVLSKAFHRLNEPMFSRRSFQSFKNMIDSGKVGKFMVRKNIQCLINTEEVFFFRT